MVLLTIVEAYIQAAMKRGEAEVLEGGVIGATVPEFPGVLAFGADVHECAKELYVRLEDWVRLSLSRGYELPIIDGIDLNPDAERLLAGYRNRAQPDSEAEFYENAQELDAAFARHDAETLPVQSYGSS